MRFPISKTIINTSSGEVIVGAVGTVRLAGTSTAATIYSASSGGSAISGSQVTSNSRGEVEFWVDNTDYAPTQLFDIYVTASNYNPFTIDNVSAIHKSVAGVNVQDYGAVGDGTTDDTTAIQDAIDSLTYGTVYFPETSSYYKITSAITGKSGVNLVGYGYGSRIHRAMGASGTQVISYDGISNSTIRGLRITGDVASPSSGGSNRVGISVTQSGSPGSRTSNVRVVDCYVESVDTGIAAAGATEQTVIEGNIISSVAIAISAGAGGVVPGSLAPRYFLIKDNYLSVSTSDTGACGVYLAGSSKYHTVANNIFTGGTYGIQGYITTTTEQDNEGHVIIGNRILNTTYDGILVTNAHATLNMKNWTVEGNYIETAGRSGILLTGVIDSRVIGNEVVSATNHGIAIILATTMTRTAQDNVIVGNVITGGGSGGWGITVEGHYMVVEGNLIRNRSSDGIRVSGTTSTTYNKVRGNISRDNATYGIRVAGSLCADNQVENNTVLNNTTAQIIDTGTRTKIVNNEGYNNPLIGTLANSATPAINFSSEFWLTGGTTTITNITGGTTGQKITIISEHAITITDGTNFFLAGSANFVMAATDTLTLVQKADGKWYEVSRSVN